MTRKKFFGALGGALFVDSTVRRAFGAEIPQGYHEMPLEFVEIGNSSIVTQIFVEPNGQYHLVSATNVGHGHKIKRVIVPVQVSLRGGSPVVVHLQVDTGADTTMINLNRVMVNGLVPDSTESATGISNQQIQVAVVNNATIAVGNLNLAMPLRFGPMAVDTDARRPVSDGLLGWDYLGHFRMIIDYQDRIFRLERHAKKTTGGQ